MATCKQCREFEKCKDDAFINGAKFDQNESVKYCTGFDPITNADRIRAMSDEELARKLVNTSYRYDWKQDEDYWYFPNGTTKTNYKPKAIEAWLEWLKQPTEE